MYPRRHLPLGHPHGLVEHIGVGPGQQGHLPLCVASNAAFWERAQSPWQIQVKRKTNFCNRVTESLTLMVSSNQSLFPHSLAHVQDSGSHVRYFHTKSKTLLENNEARGISGAPWARQPLSTAAAAWPCQAQVTVPNLPFRDKASENGLVAPPGLRGSLPPKATDFTPEFSEQFFHLEALESPIFLYPLPPNPNVDSSPAKTSMPFSSPPLRPKCHASPTRCPRRPPRSPHAAEHPATAAGCRLGRTLSSDHGLTTKRKSNARRERGGARSQDPSRPRRPVSLSSQNQQQTSLWATLRFPPHRV